MLGNAYSIEQAVMEPKSIYASFYFNLHSDTDRLQRSCQGRRIATVSKRMDASKSFKWLHLPMSSSDL